MPYYHIVIEKKQGARFAAGVRWDEEQSLQKAYKKFRFEAMNKLGSYFTDIIVSMHLKNDPVVQQHLRKQNKTPDWTDVYSEVPLGPEPPRNPTGGGKYRTASSQPEKFTLGQAAEARKRREGKG